MKTLLAVAATVLLAGSLTACAGSGDDVAADPAPTTAGSPLPSNEFDQGGSGGSQSASATPTAATPPSPGKVFTQGLVTVIDTGAGPQVCLGPTTRIYPPSCTGPALVDWTFDDTATTEGGTTFGSYALTGTWDGTALTVTDAVPAALYDAAPVESPAPAAPAQPLSAAELQSAADALATEPGVRGAAPDGQGHVLVDTVYDDGSLQAAADEQYGAGVVVVNSYLVDAG